MLGSLLRRLTSCLTYGASGANIGPYPDRVKAHSGAAGSQPDVPLGDPVDQATRWFIALNDLSISDDLRRDYAAWLTQDPVHAEEMERVAHVWSLMGDAVRQNLQPAHADAASMTSTTAGRRLLS